ncbi:MAG TPA: hypothetical protein VGO53_02325, partial [Steroidobacteraceae bacterium]|nr:hypothetical protein [Steroidobacteraceae bacterium]
MEKNEPLARALEELRAAGLDIIFSSALIEPGLVVDVEPGTGAPEDIARRILAPHGLTLQNIRPGLFAVVKGVAGSSAPATAAGAAQARAHGNAPSSEPLYEVDVYASRYQIDQNVPSAALAELSREDLEALPGLDQDVFRVTHFLPGTA